MPVLCLNFPLFLRLSLPLFLHSFLGVEATTFTMINKCDNTVWPGILSNAGVPQLTMTGFPLQTGESRSITPGSGWGGRFWARTLCSVDSTGKFSCQTGDCGSGKIECSGSGATPPATLAEFTLSGTGGMDFYDVSLVDGYNLPMLVSPHGGSGNNCSYTGCVEDLNGACPSQLQVSGGDGNTVACKSACDKFNSPEYCCIGTYGSPDTCKPSRYSVIFKKACPRAYSYAYDDKSSTFTCGGSPDYSITFCPSLSTGQKASSSEAQSSATIMNNSTMVYEGALEESSSPYTCTHSLLFVGAIAIFSVSWLLI